MTEPQLITLERTGRFFIVDQRWGFQAEYSNSLGYLSSPVTDKFSNIFEAAYIHCVMQGPYARVYREWVAFDNRSRRKSRFAYIVEARTRRQVVEEMARLGHTTMFNNRWVRPHNSRKEEEMVYESSNNENRLRVLERRQALLDAEVLKELQRQEAIARFGKDSDYPDDTVICWEQVYEKNGQQYSFVALKANGRWYTTSTFQRQSWGFEVLVEEHLSKAVEGSVHIVKKWEQI